MEKVIKLLESNQKLLQEIISNQKTIEGLLNAADSRESNETIDPAEELDSYYEKNNESGFNWTIGSCMANEISTMKIMAGRPKLWLDVNCAYQQALPIREIFKKRGFKTLDHAGHIVHQKLFIYAS